MELLQKLLVLFVHREQGEQSCGMVTELVASPFNLLADTDIIDLMQRTTSLCCSTLTNYSFTISAKLPDIQTYYYTFPIMKLIIRYQRFLKKLYLLAINYIFMMPIVEAVSLKDITVNQQSQE